MLIYKLIVWLLSSLRAETFDRSGMSLGCLDISVMRWGVGHQVFEEVLTRMSYLFDGAVKNLFVGC